MAKTKSCTKGKGAARGKGAAKVTRAPRAPRAPKIPKVAKTPKTPRRAVQPRRARVSSTPIPLPPMFAQPPMMAPPLMQAPVTWVGGEAINVDAPRHNAGKHWTPEQDHYLLYWRDQGFPYDPICAMLGKSALSGRLHILQMKKRNEGRARLADAQQQHRDAGVLDGMQYQRPLPAFTTLDQEGLDVLSMAASRATRTTQRPLLPAAPRPQAPMPAYGQEYRGPYGNYTQAPQMAYSYPGPASREYVVPSYNRYEQYEQYDDRIVTPTPVAARHAAPFFNAIEPTANYSAYTGNPAGFRSSFSAPSQQQSDEQSRRDSAQSERDAEVRRKMSFNSICSPPDSN